MHSVLPQPRLPRRLLLGAFELTLLPLRILARLVGWLLLGIALIGVPAWLVQFVISLLGGGTGGGPLPAWAMLLLLAAAIPASLAALRAANIPGPLSNARSANRTIGDGMRAQDETVPDAEREPESDWSAWTYSDQPLAWAYQTLDLERSASVVEIKAAYRRLARTYHPDRNPRQQAAECFAVIHTAYEAALHERRGDLQ